MEPDQIEGDPIHDGFDVNDVIEVSSVIQASTGNPSVLISIKDDGESTEALYLSPGDALQVGMAIVIAANAAILDHIVWLWATETLGHSRLEAGRMVEKLSEFRAKLEQEAMAGAEEGR